jgi:hypothetical protein
LPGGLAGQQFGMPAQVPEATRLVAVEDPSLSPRTNRLLTDELRRAVGADAVRGARTRPRPEREPHGGHGELVTALVADRLLVAVIFFALVVVGAIISLATGSWWALVAAVVVHAVATFAVLTTVGGAARSPEHVSPFLAARLKDEGVPAPDRYFSDLVESFAGGDGSGSAAGLVVSGRNEQRADPLEEPARAEAEQRDVLTPAGTPTAPAGAGSGRDERRSTTGRAARERALLIVCGIVVSVGAFTILMGWLAGEL